MYTLYAYFNYFYTLFRNVGELLSSAVFFSVYLEKLLRIFKNNAYLAMPEAVAKMEVLHRIKIFTPHGKMKKKF